MLTDKEIQHLANPFLRVCGGYEAFEEALPERDVEDFARVVEKAVLFDELQIWTTQKSPLWPAVNETGETRCPKCYRMFWHHIKAKMNLET